MVQTRVELRVLGTFDVVVDGVPLGDAWPNRRSSELVQLLTIAPGYRLMRDEVIEALWPSLPADAGAANLRKAAHHARRTLGNDRSVVLKRQQVVLYPDALVASDVAAFVAASTAAMEAGDAGLAAAAASAYGGTLLPSSRYEAWAEAAREVLAHRYLELLQLAGRWDLVVELDHTDERACREMMTAALVDGHRHRAIAHYGRLRQALRAELGVAPSRETESLYRSIRADLLPARRQLVGRDSELSTIDALLADDDPATHLLVVRGIAGIGKTALVRELAERARVAAWVTVVVSASDPHDAYTTLSAVLARLIDGHSSLVDSLDDRTRSVLATMVPLLAEIAPELSVTRHQIVGAVQRLIETLAPPCGLAIVVDDVDRCDASSLDVLSVLGDRPVGRLLVVFAHRDPTSSPAVPQAVARASRICPAIVLGLEPLDAQSAEALARDVDPEMDSGRLARVVARSEGVPLFLVELAGTHGTELDAQSVPGVIESRLLDLPEPEVRLLRQLALVDGMLDLDAIFALTGCNDQEVDRLLDGALATGVLVVDDAGYQFRHELVRTLLCKQLAPHHQAAAHREAARRFTELGARPGRIAAHWACGRRRDQAAEWFARAAQDAIRLGGYAAAVGYADEALAQRAQHPGGLHQRAVALDALGDLRSLAAYDAAIDVAEPDEVRELRPLQALAQIKMGDPEGALITIAGAGPLTLESQLAQALTMSGAALLGAVGPEEGTRLAAAGRERSLRSGDHAALVVASWAQAAVAHARGELHESLRADLYDTRALPRLAVTVFDGQLCITQRLLYGSRPYGEVIAWADSFAAEAKRLGAARGLAFATTLRGEASLLSGRLAAAELDLREGARLHREIAAPTGESFSLQRLSELAMVRGDDSGARTLLDEALQIARRSDVGFHLFDRIYGTRIRLAHDPDAGLDAVREAEEAVRGPFETCPGCRITLEVPAAIAAARAGDFDRLERYERSSTWLAAVVMRLPAWDAALEEVRAHRCLAHGDLSAAVDLFGKAAADFTRAGHPLDAQRCAGSGAEVMS